MAAVVSFAYSFSPIMFRIEEYRKGLLQFLTSVCAIVGGVFTVRRTRDSTGKASAPVAPSPCRTHSLVVWTQIMGIMDSMAFAVLNKASNTPLSL